MPGPAPKRDAERRRRNKQAVQTTSVDIADLVSKEVEIPVPDEEWHPTATMTYEALQRSGQAIFYEPSDWAMAYVMCEQLSRYLSPVMVLDGETGAPIIDSETGKPMMRTLPMPGAALSGILKFSASLMATEGDRRKLKIELERQRLREEANAVVAGVTNIAAKRQERVKSQ